MEIKEKIDVLVMDDDSDLCMLMETILRFNNYRVRSCNNARVFEAVLGTVEPSMIIIDMLLAGLDGRDICRQLKKADATQHIKVMMVSAHPDADKSCREAGADDFLIKPFDLDDFTAKVAAFLKKQKKVQTDQSL